MASARDIHSTEYHFNEQQAFRKWNQYHSYEHASTPLRPAQSGVGLLPAHIPARDLAHNWIDIESSLRGIGANDVIEMGRQVPVTPHSKNIPVLNLIQTAPVMMHHSEPPLTRQRIRYFHGGGESIVPRYKKVQAKRITPV